MPSGCTSVEPARREDACRIRCVASVRVAVPVVQIGEMRMPVRYGLVTVNMRMRFTDRIVGTVVMLMMLVVAVAMGMFHRLMDMLVIVPFRQMQIEARAHEDRRDDELSRHGFAEKADRQDRANERCRRKIGAGARRTEVPQGKHEQDEAHSIAEQTDRAGGSQFRQDWDTRVARQRQTQVHGSRDQSLDHGDLNGFSFGPLHWDDISLTLGAAAVVLVVLELAKPFWRDRLRF